MKDEHLNGVSLTKRESEILQLLSRGMTSKQVGLELSVSRHTIDTHRRRMLKKFHCRNTAELINYASQEGWLQQ